MKRSLLSTTVFLALASVVSAADSKGPLSGLAEREGASEFRRVATLAAEQSLAVVFHGVDRLELEVSIAKHSAAALDPDGERQIVVVQSGNGELDLMMKLLAEGNFIITVGDVPVSAAKAAFDMLLDINDSGHLTRPKASYEVDQPRFSATTGNGEVVRGLVAAYFYSPRGSRSFHTSQQDVSIAVADAIQWARDVALTEGAALSEPAKAGGWNTVYTRDHTHDCYHDFTDGGRDLAGRINVKTSYAKLKSDGNSNRDLYEVRYNAQMVPGVSLSEGNWRNDHVIIDSDVDHKFTSFELMNYSPTTTEGTNTASVDLSMSWGGASAGRSWQYSIGDVVVYDQGDYSREVVRWWHDINQKRAVGGNTLKVEPGALIEVNDGTKNIWDKLRETYEGHFVQMGDANIVTFATQMCSATWNY